MLPVAVVLRSTGDDTLRRLRRIRTADGRDWGFVLEHPRVDGRPGLCQTALCMLPEQSGARTVYRAERVEPLSIEPEVTCGCGRRGRIRVGAWEPISAIETPRRGHDPRVVRGGL